jgi:hypothetical protein
MAVIVGRTRQSVDILPVVENRIIKSTVVGEIPRRRRGQPGIPNSIPGGFTISLDLQAHRRTKLLEKWKPVSFGVQCAMRV